VFWERKPTLSKIGFGYHPEILSSFPNICGGVIILEGFTNQPSPPALLEAYFGDQKRIIAALGDQLLSEIPTLATWRSAFRRFGVDPTKYRCAAEALLRRLTKKGDIPSINTLVDICNLISIRTALPVAAFDTRYLSGPISVRFADGSEHFTAHDTPEPEHPLPGEVIFSDHQGLVVARRWCWKQSAESTVSLDTSTAVITLENQNPNSESQVAEALKELSSLLYENLGTHGQSAILGSNQAAFIIEQL
jgi:DNA/RNA-binding domain of Phe-tRNA-synthetase-like protein